MSVFDDHDVQATLALIMAATCSGSAAAAPTGGGAAPTPRQAALTALTALRHLRDHLDGWEPQLVAAARADGASWAELAPAMGVASRQAAERRYLRIRRSGQDAA